MSEIKKCENCGNENIEIVNRYKGHYLCGKCGRDTEKLYEIEHDAEIRAKAIDEFAERMSLEISESIIWGMLFDNRDNSSYDTADKIVDYVIDTAKKIAEQMKGDVVNG